MTWIVKMPDGSRFSSDDFTLDDLIRIEEETGEPWSTQNVFRSVTCAKAFLRVAYRNSGLDESSVDSLTLGRLKHVFDFEEDKPWPGDGEESDDDAPLDLKGRASSPGASDGSAGGRAKRGKSA